MDNKEITITLTAKEIGQLKDALNTMDVKLYYPKIARATRQGKTLDADFYENLVQENVTLFCKLHKALKEA